MKSIATVAAGVLTSVVALGTDNHLLGSRMEKPLVKPFWQGIGPEVTSGLESLGVILVLAAFVAGIWLYAKALEEVKSGRLIVYRDWKDFIKSSIWIVLIPLGLNWTTADSFLKIAGMGLVGFGFYCFWLMISGAFKYNVGNAKWLSMFARFAVTMLLFFSLSELYEKFENYNRGKYGYKYRYFALMRGLILPLAVFAWAFRALIQPMVGTTYCRK